MREFVHHENIVGHPPLSDFSIEIGIDVFFCDGLAFKCDDKQQRPFIPLGVLHTNNAGFCDFWVADRSILQIDGGDPFTA